MSAPAGVAICILSILLRSDIAQPIVVIDGDTLRRDGVTYRLAGFDAPEIHHAKCDEERALGLRATGRNEQLL
jgi:endonuclease YncB( thermonuclease family)